MKMNQWLAAILAVWFLMPFFPARGESVPAFTVDRTRVLQGMDRSWEQGYAPSVSRNQWTMILPVRSAEVRGAVTAELIIPDGRPSPFKMQAMAVSVREEPTGVWGIRFTLTLLPDQKNADYPCLIRLSGKTADGRETTADIPYTVQIRGCTENAEKAKIRADNLQADLKVGEESVIRVTLTNPCSAVNYEDLELRISDASGEILPGGAETLAVGKLGVGESVTVEYPVTVLEKAAVAPHVLKLDMSWTALGQQVTDTRNNTVTVRQEIRLEHGGLKMAKNVAAGDSMTVTLPLMNMGKADVVNVLATVSMPGIAERQSVLVGTIQPGETKQAQLILSPARDISGSFSGTLLVECTDQDGNVASFSLPMQLDVEPPAALSPVLSADTGRQAEKTAALTWGLGGGCGLLLLALILQGILLRRRMRVMEEEKL